MGELERALAEIAQIRVQVARATKFRGFGAMTIGTTGVIAMLAAIAQGVWIEVPRSDVQLYLRLWVCVAFVSVLMITAETLTRTARAHSELGQEMILAAVDQFLPAAGAGILLTVLLYDKLPLQTWMLPGLWQIVFSLGLFATRSSFPAGAGLAGLWYLGTGLACLAYGDGPRAFSPWMMGLPFGVGQLVIAYFVRRDAGGADGQAQD